MMTTTEEVPMPATFPYVERIVRILRDRVADDTAAIVLIDFARAYADARCAELEAVIHERNQSLRKWADWCKEAEAERDALAEKVKAMEDDARRYRQLKPQFYWEDERDMGPGGRWWVSVSVSKGRPTLDAAIDAAGGGGDG